MNRLLALLLLSIAFPSISAEIGSEDVPLWERCYELVELDRNVGGLFTTSLKESAYAGSCSGTLRTISVMSAHAGYRCDMPRGIKAAHMVVDTKILTTKDAIDLFCR